MCCKLPGPGEVLTRDQVLAIADAWGWTELSARIRSTPAPERDFVSDGGSGGAPKRWGGVDLYPAYFEHDIEYWLGGSPLDRLRADARLMLRVADMTSDVIFAEIVFNAVRAGGDFPGASWRWGEVGANR